MLHKYLLIYKVINTKLEIITIIIKYVFIYKKHEILIGN